MMGIHKQNFLKTDISIGNSSVFAFNKIIRLVEVKLIHILMGIIILRKIAFYVPERSSSVGAELTGMIHKHLDVSVSTGKLVPCDYRSEHG